MTKAPVSIAPSRAAVDEDIEQDAIERQHLRDQKVRDAIVRVQIVAIYLVPLLLLVFGVTIMLFWLLEGDTDRAADWVNLIGAGVLGLLLGSTRRLLGL